MQTHSKIAPYKMNQKSQSNCPSSAPDIPNSQIFGIVEGTVSDPTVTYLDQPLSVTPELLAAAKPVGPTEIFRFVGPCLEMGCRQFGNGQCQLAKRLVQTIPAVAQSFPACAIRQRCRWWQQEGKSACLRCSQIARTNYALSDLMRQVLTPL